MALMESLNFAEVYDMLGGIVDWETNGYPLVIPNPPPTIIPTQTTTTTTNGVPTTCSVLGLILPPFGHPEEFFTISVIVTNTGNSQGSCDIPINITDTVNTDDVVTYTISVTLDPGETKEISYDEVFLQEGVYTVEVGGISQPLKVQ